MFTSMFLHGGWLHLLGNMLFLWIFGNNVEDRLGSILFLLFYLVGGIAAALTQVVIDPRSTFRWSAPPAPSPPRWARTSSCSRAPGSCRSSSSGFFYQLIEVPALIVLGFWFVLQLVSGFAAFDAETAQGGVAFFAHIGGFVFGLASGCCCASSAPGRRGGVAGPGPMG